MEEHPTTEKVQGWDSDELLKWIQKTQPKLLRVEKNFTRFKDAEISGKIFLKKADNAKFFMNECYLPPGPSEELADLASEIRGGITQGYIGYNHLPYIDPRTELVDEIITRVNFYHIIRVRGTPATGKTTLLELVVNKLLKKTYGNTLPVHPVFGWDREDVTKATGWEAYLQKKTGIHGNTWLTYKAYLLLDEAQVSYWDSELWTNFFKKIRPLVDHPFIILFSSYGSTGSGFKGFEEHLNTPMVFSSGQQISLRPEESIDADQPIYIRSIEGSKLHTCRAVGLLLEKNEAINVLTQYTTCMQPSLALSEDLKIELFLISNGHAGLLIDLVDMISRVPELYDLIRRKIPLDLQTTRTHLFSQPLNMFQLIRGSPFSRGLPKPDILQDCTAARVFKKAIADSGICRSDLKNESEEVVKALHNIWLNGWLHERKSKNKNGDACYVFATEIHRWYCACLLRELPLDGEIQYETPLCLAANAIMKFRPCQLSDPPRSVAGNTKPLEDQYQKEFYRCLFTILEGHVVTSPEYVVKTGRGGGTIDFVLPQKRWGLELLRDRDQLVAHMQRFEPDGQYFSMIKAGAIEEYLVLDFTVVQPKKTST